MANCKYCKTRIEWQKIERKFPKKVIREIEGHLRTVYEDFGWRPFNIDGTPHNCKI